MDENGGLLINSSPLQDNSVYLGGVLIDSRVQCMAEDRDFRSCSARCACAMAGWNRPTGSNQAANGHLAVDHARNVILQRVIRRHASHLRLVLVLPERSLMVYFARVLGI